ncbi:MAG TPA: transposase, partial [Acidimicrobiales bacterium]
MLRTLNAQPTLWEAILPEMCLGLPAELEAVDRLLDDPAFFDPFRAHFHATLGRPSVPIETYLRLMFLKYRYRLGFEPLCREVADSISWQRFCRIPLGVAVPHPTTLMKITTRCGTSAVEGLNEALLAKAVAAKVLKTNRVRADTTVVEANVAYPSDSSLLAKGVAKMAATAKKLHSMGLATRTKMADRTRSVRSRARPINANLKRRNDDRLVEVRRINHQLADIADRVARQADALVRNASRKLRAAGPAASGKAAALIRRLAQTAERTRKIAAQTRQRLAGTTPDGASRIVSLHDPDARPIVKGRLGKPVEFGYKAQLVD